MGYKEGWSLWSQRNPGARVPAGPPYPHSTSSLEASHCPQPLPIARYSLPPRTLQTSGSGQRSPAAGGKRSRAARVRQVNTRRGPAATPPTLPRFPPPGRDTPFPLSRLPGRRRSCAPGPGPAGLALRTHRLRRARPGSGSLLGSAAAWDCVRSRVRAVRAGGARLAKSARDTGSLAHRPRVRVSQRETEGASYRDGEWGVRRRGCRDTLPHPAPRPRRRRRKRLAAGDTGHKDLVPGADPSFSLRDPGSWGRVAREIRPTDGTDRQTHPGT